MDFGRPNAEIGRKMANGRLISSTAGNVKRSQFSEDL